MSHTPPPWVPVSIGREPLAPPPPITSKLAVVAERMDMFVRLENEALVFSLTEANRMIAEVQAQLDISRQLNNGLLNRVQELSNLFESELDRNERLVNRVVALEQSVLACPGHQARSRLFRIERNPRVALGLPRRVRRQLDFEFVDLTTDSEGETTQEE